jgi:hypothetical protein
MSSPSLLLECAEMAETVRSSFYESLLDFVARFRFDETEDGYAIVHAQGCCLTNDGLETPRAGYGVWFGENHPL